jgi:hypothetical protein
VKYVKRNALAGRRFSSSEELNGWLERLRGEVADLRIHGTKRNGRSIALPASN